MSEDAIAVERRQIEQQVRGRTLCDLLAEHADGHGDAPAMSWKRDGAWQTLSWRQYRERVAEVAMGLAGLGVGRGDFVAIMATNRPEHVQADQAAIHAGATPTTFYFTLAPEQIRYVAGHCEAKVAVLEDRDMLKRWQDIRDELPALRHVVLLDGAEEADGPGVLGWDELVRRGREALAADRSGFEELRGRVVPEDNAALLYTSGTTGPPKGVLLTHQNLLFESVALDRLTGLSPEGSSVSYLPLAHIAERVLSIYGPLTMRTHVWFCPEPAQAVEYVREARPTLFFGVPRVWEKVRAGINAKLAAEENERKRKITQKAVETGLEVVRRQQRGEAVPFGLRARHAVLERLVLAKVRQAIGLDRCAFASSAASPLAVDVAEFFAALGLPLVEVYGMTETTGVATGNRPGKVKIGTVGPALAGVEIRLAADAEVLVRGPVNTPGYFRQPEATAELIDAEGWLHTGDVGELDDDGYLKIVDRKKELIITSSGKNLVPGQHRGPPQGAPADRPGPGLRRRPAVRGRPDRARPRAGPGLGGPQRDGRRRPGRPGRLRRGAGRGPAGRRRRQPAPGPHRAGQAVRGPPGRVDRRERGADPHPQAPPPHHPRQVRRTHRRPVPGLTRAGRRRGWSGVWLAIAGRGWSPGRQRRSSRTRRRAWTASATAMRSSPSSPPRLGALRRFAARCRPGRPRAPPTPPPAAPVPPAEAAGRCRVGLGRRRRPGRGRRGGFGSRRRRDEAAGAGSGRWGSGAGWRRSDAGNGAGPSAGRPSVGAPSRRSAADWSMGSMRVARTAASPDGPRLSAANERMAERTTASS